MGSFPGFSVLVSFGRYAGFDYSRYKTSVRLVLGWVSIVVGPWDLDAYLCWHFDRKIARPKAGQFINVLCLSEARSSGMEIIRIRANWTGSPSSDVAKQEVTITRHKPESLDPTETLDLPPFATSVEFNVVKDTTFDLELVAIDADGNRSEPAKLVGQLAKDIFPPAPPTDLGITEVDEGTVDDPTPAPTPAPASPTA